jgi:hypothetical protein
VTIYPTAGASIDSQLARAAGYITGPWWSAKRGYASSGIPALTWNVVASNPSATSYNQELAVRGAALAAFALTVPIYTGTYNEWSPSITSVTAVQRLTAAKLVVACARQHVDAQSPLANAQTWGHSWQSPLWAAYVGLTALMGWYDLIPNQVDRNNVLAMIESECNWVMSRGVDFWKIPDGLGGFTEGPNTLNPNDGPIRVGNSPAEELSWNATVLWIGTSIMPTHVNASAWYEAAIELNVCSFSSIFDLSSQILVAEIPISTWIGGRGFNIDSLDLVTNHGRIHPDYMTSVTQNFFGYVARGINGYPTPIGTAWNFAPVYRALQSSPLDSSGTRAYAINDPSVHFPSTTPVSDWGSRRPAAYACFDGLAAMFASDLATYLNQDLMVGMDVAPQYWLNLHAGDSADMQLRPTTATHATGSFVAVAGEATYPEEDVYAASQLAFLRLTQYVRRSNDSLWSLG